MSDDPTDALGPEAAWSMQEPLSPGLQGQRTDRLVSIISQHPQRKKEYESTSGMRSGLDL